MLMRLCMGSPPQVRGKRWALWMSIAALRITPAGAGKTLQRKKRIKFDEDHPRRCGENGVARAFQPVRKGSPPQVRGKHGRSVITSMLLRITPAGAGKTWDIAFYVGKTQDHPRRCGENSVALWAWRDLAGSPPQVRGKR